MAEIRDIDKATMKEIVEFEKIGAQIVSLEGNNSPKVIVSKINEFVKDAKKEKRQFSEDETLALGILLGWQYVRGLNWHWGEAIWDANEDSSAIGVLNEDNSLFNNPMWWMHNVLNTDRAVNFMLNYNVIVANKAPQAQPNEAYGVH